MARIVRIALGLAVIGAFVAATPGLVDAQTPLPSGPASPNRNPNTGPVRNPYGGSSTTPRSPTGPGTTPNAGSGSVAGPALGPTAGPSAGPTAGPANSAGARPANATNGPAGQGFVLPITRQQAGRATPQTPAWYPLPPEHEKYLDQVLGYWQHSSSQIKRYRCRFTRWEYDGVFVARDAATGELPAKTQSAGAILYSAPDKGMFKIDKLLHYTAPQKPGEKAQYLAHPDDRGDHWICDGKSVFAFDHQKKQLIQTELPPDMQGKAIVDGPLPFMFGAEADKIKQRFWVRVITPKDAKGEYWLEAVPKTMSDAGNFKFIHIIIDEADFLPKAMAIFDRNYDPVRNPSATNFVFERREKNWNDTLDRINIFSREFWEPATPLGYQKVVQRYQPTEDERVGAAGTPANQATRPAAPAIPRKR